MKFLGVILLIPFLFSCNALQQNDIFPDFTNIRGGGDDYLMSPCASGDQINPEDLPDSIKDYLAAEYDGVEVVKAEVYNFSEGTFYEVKLANGRELYFNGQGELLAGGDDGSGLGNHTAEEFQRAVDKAREYLQNNYPDLVDAIDEIVSELEFGYLYVRVKFTDGREIYFNLEGTPVCGDDDHSSDDDDLYDDHHHGGSDSDGYHDHDDDDDHHDGHHSMSSCFSGEEINPDNLPDGVKTYLETEYSGVAVIKAEVYTFDEENFYEVKLENGKKLYFNEQGDLLPGSDGYEGSDYGDHTYEEYQMAKDKALEYIRANYPDRVDDIDEIEPELEFGKLFVKVEFEDDLELYFDLDGNLVCMDDDHSGSGSDDDHDDHNDHGGSGSHDDDDDDDSNG